MKTTSQMHLAAFDPFGEPAEAVRTCAAETSSRGTRLAAVVFWTLAMVLLAGRVYLGDQAPGRDVVAAAPTVTLAQAANLH